MISIFPLTHCFNCIIVHIAIHIIIKQKRRGWHVVEQVRVNLTLEREIWEKFSTVVPNRKKSSIVNELLKKEVERVIRQNEEKALTVAFGRHQGIRSASQPLVNGTLWMQKGGSKWIKEIFTSSILTRSFTLRSIKPGQA